MFSMVYRVQEQVGSQADAGNLSAVVSAAKIHLCSYAVMRRLPAGSDS
jgi:hypothetical protein